MFRRAAVIIIGSISLATPALANIDLELRPVGQTVSIGETVNVGLYAVSDDDTDQLLQAAEVIIAWDPNFLQLLGNDNTGAVPLQSSGFPANDAFNINEVVPPQDGDGIYVAFAPFGNPAAATPQGSRLTTLQFLALADTPQTLVDILESSGAPEGHTIVFDGIVPNLDVTGTRTGSVIEIASDPTLSLTADPSFAGIGDSVVVTLSMLNLGSKETVGFQAFLTFDSTRLTFISGSYTPDPFGQPIILPIEADGENIDLAAGIDLLGGQMPTSDDAELVHLTFEAVVPGCVFSVGFREHKPPTALTDIDGLPIEPLQLIGLPDLSDEVCCPDCLWDVDSSGDVRVPDLIKLLSCWGPLTGDRLCECLDLDGSDDIRVPDLIPLLAAWGPCEDLPGTCCNADGMGGCQILSVDACVAEGGDFLGSGTDCDECPHPACDAGIGDCCSANGTPGCEDPTCCETVCEVDPDCCDVEWDNACADQAEALCILCLPPPPNDDCEDRIPILNGDTPFDTTAATTDGPAHPGDCQFDGQTYRDMWFDYIATCTGDLTVSTCGQADYDTDLVVYDGCDCEDLELLGCNEDAAGCAGFSSELTVPVVEDNCYLVRVGGFNPNDFGTGTVTITCVGG